MSYITVLRIGHLLFSLFLFIGSIALCVDNLNQRDKVIDLLSNPKTVKVHECLILQSGFTFTLGVGNDDKDFISAIESNSLFFDL